MTDTPPPLRRLTMDGPLSNALVDRIQAVITASAPETREFVLEARGITGLDPVAAARLWLFCDRGETSGRRRVRIESLAPEIARRLRRHPLRLFLTHDEAVFDDPFASLAPSTR